VAGAVGLRKLRADQLATAVGDSAANAGSKDAPAASAIEMARMPSPVISSLALMQRFGDPLHVPPRAL
jgi:hypothetical protein